MTSPRKRPASRVPERSAPVSLARALSKLGVCSRAQATAAVIAGRVTVNGSVEHDPNRRVEPARDRITFDGERVRAAARTYVMLNKPAGLVTSAADERGRDTVYICFDNAPYPRLVPVGRLDRDSQGLLLFTNDTRWADRIASPASHIEKVYRVQLDRPIDERLIDRLRAGVASRGETLRAVRVAPLTETELEMVLDEGRNRQVRRMVEATGAQVQRLVRTAIGPLRLGRLQPGMHRPLTARELSALEAALRKDA